MHDLSLIEEYYKKFINNLPYWIPDGIQAVNLELLQHYDLLHFNRSESQDSHLTTLFHIVESQEKITLVNDEFIIWILPERIDNATMTYVLIALNKEDQPKLETAFTASGVYNTSKLVLRVLEKILLEIQENEKLLSKIKDT